MTRRLLNSFRPEQRTERYRKFVIDVAAQRARLRYARVMGLRRRAYADKAGLACDDRPMFAVAMSLGLGERKMAFVNSPCWRGEARWQPGGQSHDFPQRELCVASLHQASSFAEGGWGTHIGGQVPGAISAVAIPLFPATGHALSEY
jgi:hypothetical protein